MGYILCEYVFKVSGEKTSPHLTSLKPPQYTNTLNDLTWSSFCLKKKKKVAYIPLTC